MKNFIEATMEGNTSVYDYAGFNTATWNPTVEFDFPFLVFGNLKGKTYAEKKQEVREKAIEFQRIDEGGLSYGEYALIAEYFETYGKRYGLMREFKNEGIL